MGEPVRITSAPKAEPCFDIDVAIGQAAEVQLKDLLRSIVSGNGQVEVKCKRTLDEWFYVETHCDKGRRGTFRPSGISVTTADTWCITLGSTRRAVLVPTDQLRAMLTDASTQDREETDGTCPTKGKLVNLMVLLFREQQRQRALFAGHTRGDQLHCASCDGVVAITPGDPASQTAWDYGLCLKCFQQLSVRP